MSETGEARRTETLSAHVPPDVAREVKALAQAGERSISREITRALRRHVATESSVPADGPPAGGSFAGMNPAERRAPDKSSPAVEARAARGGEQ